MNVGFYTNYKHFGLLGNSVTEALGVISEIGFGSIAPDEYGFSPSEKDNYLKEVREGACKYGLNLSYFHLPFVIEVHSDVFLGDEFFNKVLEYIDMAVELGVKYVVAHPFTPEKYQFYKHDEKFDYEPIREFCEEVNLKFFRRLQPYLLKAGLRCAIENLFTTDEDYREQLPSACCTSSEWKKYIDTLGDPYCACLDTGHANLALRDNGKLFQLVRDMGHRIEVLHINDNYAKWLKIGDWHQLPGVGDIDMIEFAKVLKEIGYNGDLNFEVIINARNRDFCIAQLKYIKAVGDIMIAEGGLS